MALARPRYTSDNLHCHNQYAPAWSGCQAPRATFFRAIQAPPRTPFRSPAPPRRHTPLPPHVDVCASTRPLGRLPGVPQPAAAPRSGPPRGVVVVMVVARRLWSASRQRGRPRCRARSRWWRLGRAPGGAQPAPETACRSISPPPHSFPGSLDVRGQPLHRRFWPASAPAHTSGRRRTASTRAPGSDSPARFGLSRRLATGGPALITRSPPRSAPRIGTWPPVLGWRGRSEARSGAHPAPVSARRRATSRRAPALGSRTPAPRPPAQFPSAPEGACGNICALTHPTRFRDSWVGKNRRGLRNSGMGDREGRHVPRSRPSFPVVIDNYGMNASYSTYEAKARFSEVLRLVDSGTPVTVTRRGEPIAEIRPVEKTPQTIAERLDELERRGVLVRRRAPHKPLGAVARRAGALKRFLAERSR